MTVLPRGWAWASFNDVAVVDADLVEIIFDRETTLNLIRLDQSCQHVSHNERPNCAAAATQVVGQHEDSAQIIGWMTALRRGEGIVQIEPPDHAAQDCGGTMERWCGFHQRINFKPSSPHD